MAENLTFHTGAVTREDRSRVLNQRGVTIWMTGLSGSGKSTVAVALERALIDQGHVAYRLDGDNIRLGLNADLGFAPEDRTENIRRCAEVARLFADAGIIVIACFISPYRTDRESARESHAAAGIPFLEVHIDCPLEEAERRDPKGLYRKARAGEIAAFTGISNPYEPPTDPDLRLRTDQMSLSEEIEAIMALLREQALLAATS